MSDKLRQNATQFNITNNNINNNDKTFLEGMKNKIIYNNN